MTVEISCYAIHYSRWTSTLLFIRYDNVVEVSIDESKCYIMNISEILNNEKLYQYYLLSLILSEDGLKYDNDDEKFYLEVKVNWKRMHYNSYDIVAEFSENPLLREKPIALSSLKRMKNFWKKFDEFVKDNYGSSNFYYPHLPANLDILDDYLWKTIIYDMIIIQKTNILYKKREIICKTCKKIFIGYNISDDISNKILKYCDN